MKKISIIIPVYNVEKYLEQCLNSIYELNLTDKEIILVNDGSTDNSLKILEKYQREYPQNTKVITQVNQGLSEARNTGVRNACGEYILFIDSDDFINPEVTENLLNNAILDKVDILIGDFIEYYSDSDLKNIKNRKIDYSSENNGLYFIEVEIKNNCLRPNVWKNVYRRNFMIENNIFFKKGLLHEDNLFTPIVFYYAKKVKYFGGPPFYYYRLNNFNSIMKTKNKKNYQHTLYIIDTIIDFCEKNNIKNVYFNKNILGLYTNVILEGKFKNWEIFKKLLRLKYNFKEYLKLIFILFYSLKCKKIDFFNLD